MQKLRKMVVLVATATLLLAAASAEAGSFYKELSSQWWQWTMSLPTSSNPLTDATGDRCGFGQRGDFWFLGGAFGDSPPVQRQCAIPEGVHLFFPVFNYIWLDNPGQCGQPEPTPVTDMRAGVRDYINNVSSVSAVLDDKQLELKRILSDVFPVALPADSLFAPLCAELRPGIYPAAVADGYYAHVPQLKAGNHVLVLQGTHSNGTKIDVQYNLTVVPSFEHGR